MVLTQACEPFFKQLKKCLTATYGFHAFMHRSPDGVCLAVLRVGGASAGLGWHAWALMNLHMRVPRPLVGFAKGTVRYGTVCETEMKTYVRRRYLEVK
jgi:hypothetical protein